MRAHRKHTLEQKKSELETTKKELNRFRNMVLLNPEKNTLYTQMTHEELRIRALNLVLKIKESSRLTKQKEGEASTNYDKAMIKEDDYQKKVDALGKYMDISLKNWQMTLWQNTKESTNLRQFLCVMRFCHV